MKRTLIAAVLGTLLALSVASVASAKVSGIGAGGAWMIRDVNYQVA